MFVKKNCPFEINGPSLDLLAAGCNSQSGTGAQKAITQRRERVAWEGTKWIASFLTNFLWDTTLAMHEDPVQASSQTSRRCFGSQFTNLFMGEDWQLAWSCNEGGGSKRLSRELCGIISWDYCFKREAHLKEERARQSQNGPFPTYYCNGKKDLWRKQTAQSNGLEKFWKTWKEYELQLMMFKNMCQWPTFGLGVQSFFFSGHWGWFQLLQLR